MPRIWIMSPLFTVFPDFPKMIYNKHYFYKQEKKITSKHISTCGLNKMLTCYSGPHRLQLLLLISAKYYFHRAGLWARAVPQQWTDAGVRVQGLLLGPSLSSSLQLPFLRLLPFRWHWLLLVLSLLGGPGSLPAQREAVLAWLMFGQRSSSPALCAANL